MRILLAEDDSSLGQGLTTGLQKLGYTVDWVRDAILAESAVSDADDIDIMILDLGLPRQDGLEVLRTLRAKGSDLPVLVLAARDTVENRIQGLDQGADDYLVKSFDLHELATRLRAIERWPRRAAVALRGSGTGSRGTYRDPGRAVTLSLHELSILENLMSDIGRALSRQQIEASLYGWKEGVESNAVEVHIHHLRKKLGKELIRTVRGVGYLVPKRTNDGR